MSFSTGLRLRSNKCNGLIRLFSSSPALSHPKTRPPNFFDGGSGAYSHAVKYTRPLTINWGKRVEHLRNSVCFVGSVVFPVKEYATRIGKFGVYTHLEVQASRLSGSWSRFRIVAEMWNEMARVAVEHLRPNDFIYVSGCLNSYERVFENGNREIRYKVIVKELNYVKQHKNSEKIDSSSAESAVGQCTSEKYRKRLHLWQVFFCEPFQWRDFRRTKMNPRQPDFKHKDTGEALWIQIDDPPWIGRQLELYDLQKRKEF